MEVAWLCLSLSLTSEKPHPRDRREGGRSWSEGGLTPSSRENWSCLSTGIIFLQEMLLHHRIARK